MLKKFKILLKLSLKDKILIITEYLYIKTLQKLNFHGKFRFDNRSKNNENLLIILTGYQEYLDDKVLDRVKSFLDPDIDVCLCIAGKEDAKLSNVCKENNWSYLTTRENKVSLICNLAIKFHSNAKWIYKIDGDIFITEGMFKKLKEKYILTEKNSEFNPGIITPVININGFTYSYFLEKIGKKEDFIKRFGNIKQVVAKKGMNIWHSGEVAKFIWENTLPIDDVNSKFFNSIDISINFVTNSIRYSIGCMMINRSLWENMGGFNIAIEGALGKEEEQILNYCTNNCLPVIMCENCLVGHFSFGPQREDMKEYFLKNKNLF